MRRLADGVFVSFDKHCQCLQDKESLNVGNNTQITAYDNPPGKSLTMLTF